MSLPLRVGIIGASADGGWARDGHVPAVQRLSGLLLAAVATNSRTTADAAAKAFGVDAAYASGAALIDAPDIDIVTIATRVPDHRELALAAIAAKKHVYCEWPLGCGKLQADELSLAASAAGVHTAIGLQMRGSPVVRRAREIVRSGRVGRVLDARLYGSTVGFGPEVPEQFLYLEDPENFANLVTIQGAHAVDLAAYVVHSFESLAALATIRYPVISAGVDGERRQRVVPDHLLLQARFADGAPFSLEMAGGRPPETPFVFVVEGESGTVRIDGGEDRGFQSGRVRLSVDGVAIDVDEGELASMPDAAANVAGVYQMLRDDIRHESRNVADFAHASALTRLVDDMFTSSTAGKRVTGHGWPTR